MKIFVVVASVMLLVASAVCQSTPLRVEKTFQNGGHIEMHLGGGDYEVRAGAADKIIVTWTIKNDADANKVKTSANVVGPLAKLETSGPHNDSHAVIEIPPQTNVVIRLAAGDLRVRGITGNKDISSHAGDVDIEIGNPEQYALVEASVKIGDLNAAAFGASKDGFFRSLHLSRHGKYALRAHLGAGDLNLH